MNIYRRRAITNVITFSPPLHRIKATPTLPLHRIKATLTRREYAGDDDEEDAYDRAEARKKEAAAHLNRLFYTDFSLSASELKDLILQTFKKLNTIKIMLIDKQFMLVVYPEIKSPNDTDYMNELNLIAELLSDFTMKHYVQEEFKKIKEYKGEILYIPLQIKNVL